MQALMGKYFVLTEEEIEDWADDPQVASERCFHATTEGEAMNRCDDRNTTVGDSGHGATDERDEDRNFLGGHGLALLEVGASREGAISSARENHCPRQVLAGGQFEALKLLIQGEQETLVEAV